MASWLIESDLFDRQSSPVRAKVECCKSRDLFGCQIKDCSVTRILSSSITGRHLWPTGSLIGFFFFTSVQRCSRRILQTQPTGRSCFWVFSVLWDLFVILWGFSSNSIFSSVLYLLLNSGVSFRVFVSCLCLDWDRWHGLSWHFDLVMTVYAGFCLYVLVWFP